MSCLHAGKSGIYLDNRLVLNEWTIDNGIHYVKRERGNAYVEPEPQTGMKVVYKKRGKSLEDNLGFIVGAGRWRPSPVRLAR